MKDISYHIRKKGLAPIIRDPDGLKVKIKYLLNRQHFVIYHRTRNVNHNYLYQIMLKLRSWCTSLGILGAKMRASLISYISKTTDILKSIIEQKLLEIMFVTRGDFNFLAKRAH